MIVRLCRFFRKERLGALLFVSVLVAGCGGPVPDQRLQFSGGTMGTQYHVSLYAPGSESVSLEMGIQRILNRVTGRMSTYEPESDVTRFNRAPAGTWVEVAPETARVVAAALRIARDTEGLFDPTVLPLVDAWGFGPRGRPEERPDAGQLDTLLDTVGWEALAVRMDPPALRAEPARQIDLSGIAKGYGADAVAEYLTARGVDHFLVELGGDMVVRGGKPDGSPWRVAIETPEPDERAVYRVLELTDGALVTSGDYRNYYTEGDQRWTHVVDPRDGKPIQHSLASVSVFAADAMTADALATALLVAGPDQARTLAERLDASALLIERKPSGFEQVTTGDFEALAGGESQ